MRDIIKVLIADDDYDFCEMISDYLKKQEGISVVGIAPNGEEAVEKIQELKPDIALVDILMPLKDGLGVLEALKKMRQEDTSCIIISALTHDRVAKKAVALGAKYFIVKPFRMDYLVNRIRHTYYSDREEKMAERPLEMYREHLKPSREFASEEEENVFRISNLLNRLSISPSIKGYYYIRNAVEMVLEDPEAIIGITKRMYPDVAKEYKTTSSKVERAIRHAIESSWKKGSGKTYSEIVGYHCGEKPTNGQFIATLAEYIRLNEA